MERVYNFSAGPSMMPETVLKRAADEMLNCNGSGMSVMEMSHRSKAFEEIINGAEATLRELLNIPDNYKVLFLQGGGSTQFAMIPLNLMKKKKIDSVTIKFRYSIRVTNEGQIAGYAKEIKDYIPDGLKFVAEDNQTWTALDEKTIVTDSAKDILLKPGESTEVEVILTWENAYGKDYDIQVSNDGNNWTTVYENNNCKGGEESIVFDATECRYVKMQGVKRALAYGY